MPDKCIIHDRFVVARELLADTGSIFSADLRREPPRALADWIAVRGVEPGPLFTRMTQHGACTLDPITAHAVYTILKKRGKEAGVESFSPHDLRRTVVSMLLTQGTDANIASKLVGHKDVRTTLRYDRRGYEAVEQAVQEKIHIPYFGRPAKESL